MTTAPGSGRSAGWWLLLLGAVVAAASHLGTRGNPDVTWYLYAAREVLHGARYGTDILEVNPPFIVWLKIPAVLAAAWLGVREWSAWVVEVMVLAGAAIALARTLLPRGVAREARGIVGVSLGAAALLLLPGEDFGQREHVAVILALPYLVLVARRMDGDPVPLLAAAGAGLLGGVGFVIKPYLALVPVVVLTFEAYRLGLRKVLLPEHGAALAVGLVYFGTLPWTAPGFLERAPALWVLYRRYLPRPIWESALFSRGVLPGYLALAAYLALRPRIGPRAVALADALAIATVAFQLTGILQGKGWRYYFVPAQVCAFLLSVTLATASWGLLRRPLERVYHALTVGMLAALAGSTLPGAALRMMHPLDPRLSADPDLNRLLPLVRSTGPYGIAVLSSAAESGFPLVLEGGGRWALRQLSLWPLVTFYWDQVRQRRLVIPRSLAERSAAERDFANGVVASLRRRPPALLLVLGPSPESKAAGAARMFDYLGYFSEEPGFADLLAQYQDEGTVGSYQVYRRRDWKPPEPGLVAGMDRTEEPSAGGSVDRWSMGLLLAGFVLGASAAWPMARSKGPNPV